MKLEELTDSAIDFILDGMNTDKLSNWEKGFIESVSDQWYRIKKLSDKQKEVLGNIWDKQS